MGYESGISLAILPTRASRLTTEDSAFFFLVEIGGLPETRSRGVGDGETRGGELSGAAEGAVIDGGARVFPLLVDDVEVDVGFRPPAGIAVLARHRNDPLERLQRGFLRRLAL